MMTRRRTCVALGVLGATLLVVSGCRELPQAAQANSLESTPVVHDQLVFVYDRSVSIQDHELEHARELTRNRVRTLDFGDRIVAIELLQKELDEQPERWATQVPDREFPDRMVPRDSVAKQRFLKDVEDYIVKFSDSEGRDSIGGTDILSTMHLVAAELQAHPDYRTTFILFSDMLQANDVMNLEGLTRMPADNWVQQQADRGTLPDLTGLCVFLAGARTDTPTSQVVKEFWTKYFDATGAILLNRNYSYRPVAIPQHPCAGA